MLGHEAERIKRIGNLLLIGDGSGVDRAHTIGLTFQRSLENRRRNADAGAELIGGFVLPAACPLIDIGNSGEDSVDDFGVRVGELLAGKIKLPVGG